MREIARGLPKKNTPILKQLSQNPDKQSKYQWVKYSKHLWNVYLKEKKEKYWFPYFQKKD